MAQRQKADPVWTLVWTGQLRIWLGQRWLARKRQSDL